jgi:exonuclease SbcC
MGFKDVELDLSDVKGSVIAVVGDNGAGKSTLLESMGYAGLYRIFPSREQGIHKYCNSNESFIENEFTFSGIDYRTKILINPAGTRVEAYLFENGKAVNDGKTGSFDSEVVKRFGSGDLVLSSVFSAQNSSGSFLSLPRPKRKELFISMLNLGILQQVSAYSADLEGQYTDKEKELTTKIQSLESVLKSNVPDKEVLLKTKDDIEKLMDGHNNERDRLKSIYEEMSKTSERMKEIRERANRISNQIGQLDYNKTSLIKKITENKKEMMENIEESVAGIMALEMEEDALSLYEHRKNKKDEELLQIEQEESARVLKLSEASRSVDGLKNNLATEEDKFEQCAKHAKRLEKLPCGGSGKFAGCPLIKNSVEQRDLIDKTENQIRSLRFFLNDARAEAQKLLDIKKVDASSIKAEIKDLVEKINSSKRASVTLATMRARTQKNDLLRHMIEDQEQTLASLVADIESKRDEFYSITNISEAVNPYELLEIKASITAVDKLISLAKDKLHNTIMALGRVDVIKENIKSAQDTADKLNKELKSIRMDKSEWGHLSYAFGPKAIQSLEIDSAGPWVSDIINDLLRSCFGTRFSINLITQAAKANKSGMKDFFDMEVVDSYKNRTGLINDLSGGEKVICSEAISLAISLYNSNVGGVKWDTLYRDECSGALSPKNALLYIKMLRRAIELGKFKRCFFIAHQPELVDASDNQIVINNGLITIK